MQPTITLLYKRKLFIYLVLIVKSWINKGFVSGDRARRLSTDLIQIKSGLTKQNLKKMGKFKSIEFELEPEQTFNEFERGLSTQLLYALEDFNEWHEGKLMRKKLLQSKIRNEPRFQITELLYKIAQKINNGTDKESKLKDVDDIHDEMIKNYFTEIIEIQFKLIPEISQIFYGAFTVHMVNIAFEASKITAEDRSVLINKLSDYEKHQYKQLIIPLLNFTDSRIFSEDYEKEFSSIISVFHLAVPIFNL
jgi:hypothetical protein